MNSYVAFVVGDLKIIINNLGVPVWEFHSPLGQSNWPISNYSPLATSWAANQ